MAKYTVELGRLIETGFDLGLNKYPIFDENYRRPLNNKILRHYWFREIGFETAELFKRYLNQTLAEIMPYYNQLYKSELIEFNPLYNVDKFEDANTKFDGKTNSTTHADDSGHGKVKTDNTNVFSDTPQGQLTIGNIRGNVYATTASIDDDLNESWSSGTADSTGQVTADDLTHYAKHVAGKEAGVSYSKMLQEFRETFLNIDMMIIDDLRDLFMQIY